MAGRGREKQDGMEGRSLGMEGKKSGGQHTAPKMTERDWFDMALEDAEVFRLLRQRDLKTRTLEELRREDAAREAARERKRLREKQTRVWERTYAAGMVVTGWMLLSALQSASTGRILGMVVQAALAGLIYLAAGAARKGGKR